MQAKHCLNVIATVCSYTDLFVLYRFVHLSFRERGSYCERIVSVLVLSPRPDWDCGLGH